MTIDDLIDSLKTAKEKHGGKSPIFIRDADTSWHLKVKDIRESNTEPGRVLLIPEDYSDY